MWFCSWLLNRTSIRSPRRDGLQIRPTTRRFRPQLEVLEDRTVPSQISLTVSSLADLGSGTLRAAILTADAGSHSDKFTIGFAVNGTIDLQTPLPDLNNSITIQGPGASGVIVERAAGVSFSSAIVTVDSGQTASLSDITVANGNAGGIVNEGTLTVANSTVMNNSGFVPAPFNVPMGGGIFNDTSGALTVTNSIVSGNSALFGGGIFSFGTLTVSGSAVSGNFAVPFTTSGVTFRGFGGGIYNTGPMTVSGSAISGNTADGGGGGIREDFFKPFNTTVGNTISTSTISGNFAGFQGGGIEDEGVLAISSCKLFGNTAGQNGGAILNGYFLTVSGCAFTGNSATGVDLGGVHFAGSGGAIYNDVRAQTTVRDSVFGGSSTNSSNSAELGGAIYNGGSATLDVRGSSFTSNTASDSGGAIYNLGAATVQGSTLSGNTAGSAGGGIFNAASGTLTVKDSTVLNNTAPLGADIYNLGVLTLDDSTVGVIGP